MNELNDSCMSSSTDGYDDNDQLVVNIVGWLAVTCTISRCLAPIPSLLNIYKQKSTQEYSAVPFIAQIANALIWLLYFGASTHPIPAMTSNVVAIVLALGYLAVFGMFITISKKRTFCVLICLGVGGSLGSGLFIYILHEIIGGGCWHLQVMGIIGNICSTLVYMGPLAAAKSVWTTKNTRFMPWQMVGAGFVGSILWTTYGVLLKDMYLTIVSTMGCVITSTQVFILLYTYFRYSRRMHLHKVLSDQEEPVVPHLELGDDYPSMIISTDETSTISVMHTKNETTITENDGSDSGGSISEDSKVEVVDTNSSSPFTGTVASTEEI